MSRPLHASRHTRGGEVIDLAPYGGDACIALQGAQLLSWRPAGQAHDVLWCSAVSPLGGSKAIRGGIPVCWPWFGPHATDAKRPQHGFARNIAWRFDGTTNAAQRIVASFTLTSNAYHEHDPLLALEARLTMSFDISGTLHMQLLTTNTGAMELPLSPALHTYFAVSDVAAIAIEGLEGATYLDNTRGGAATQQTGPLRIAAETIALFDDAPSRQTLIDPGFKREIQINRAGPGSTIVWNPGATASTMADIPAGDASRFVCVESGCIGIRTVLLDPGTSHSLDVSIRVG